MGRPNFVFRPLPAALAVKLVFVALLMLGASGRM